MGTNYDNKPPANLEWKRVWKRRTVGDVFRSPGSAQISTKAVADLIYDLNSELPQAAAAQGLGAVPALLARWPSLTLQLFICDLDRLSEWAQLLRDLRGGLDHVSRSPRGPLWCCQVPCRCSMSTWRAAAAGCARRRPAACPASAASASSSPTSSWTTGCWAAWRRSLSSVRGCRRRGSSSGGRARKRWRRSWRTTRCGAGRPRLTSRLTTTFVPIRSLTTRSMTRTRNWLLFFDWKIVFFVHACW